MRSYYEMSYGLYQDVQATSLRRIHSVISLLRGDLDQINGTEEHAWTYLREHLDEAGYLRVTGQDR
jgi:hypothetical protein